MRMTSPSDAIDTPLRATADGPYVGVSGDGGVSVGMTPEAVLGSLEPLRAAAERAIRNREAGVELDERDGLD